MIRISRRRSTCLGLLMIRRVGVLGRGSNCNWEEEGGGEMGKVRGGREGRGGGGRGGGKRRGVRRGGLKWVDTMTEEDG